MMDRREESFHGSTRFITFAYFGKIRSRHSKFTNRKEFLWKDYLDKIHRKFEIYPACGLIGPYQVGKATLAKQFAEISNKESIFFDLENPEDFNSF
jgi:predicted AAA+ superfamily ATPase